MVLGPQEYGPGNIVPTRELMLIVLGPQQYGPGNIIVDPGTYEYSPGILIIQNWEHNQSPRSITPHKHYEWLCPSDYYHLCMVISLFSLHTILNSIIICNVVCVLYILYVSLCLEKKFKPINCTWIGKQPKPLIPLHDTHISEYFLSFFFELVILYTISFLHSRLWLFLISPPQRKRPTECLLIYIYLLQEYSKNNLWLNQILFE